MRRRRIERNVTRGTGISAERLRAEGRWMNAELSERYNREYERCMTEEIPDYLG
jgi:hypothetical protein